ncbi:MAG: sigma-70 family RNA polymerase sigma factor [Kofleriaceae bacterium]|nr:sigma-70 family RNA polymerase sigma factor [Kofleriaceae bacterium]
MNQTDRDWLAQRFEEQRSRLLAVAYRMLGSLSEAEDAVQEAWLRLSGAAHEDVDNLGAWLTTVVARISLNVLRSRKTRSEAHVPEPILDRADGASPEHQALLADGVGLALLVVLETLTPAERVAFVLHDIFDLSFDEIASIVQRTPDATRQLASRGRRRVQGRNATPDADMTVQRRVVDAFLSAAQDRDFDRLVAVLDPDVVLRRDASATGTPIEVRGAEQVARGASSFSRPGLQRRPVLVNGVAGAVAMLEGKPVAVMACTVKDEKIVEIEIVGDPARLAQLDLTVLDT